jgi:hypothetical protein
VEKPLILSMRSLSGTSAEVEMVYGGRLLGHLELLSEDLGEFVEALREGFQVVIAAGNPSSGHDGPGRGVTRIAQPDKRQADMAGYPSLGHDVPGRSVTRNIQAFVDELDEEDD